jgi:DNA-binding MarR family transcriptional regulator
MITAYPYILLRAHTLSHESGSRARATRKRQLTSFSTQLEPRDYQAAAALRSALRAFVQASERTLREHGLTTERYELMLAVKCAGHDAERAATISGLTSILGVAQSSITQLVRRVEDAGLLRREVSPDDARVRYLRLTNRGERQLA